LIYVSATAGVVHYLWLVKKDISKPVEYACLLGVLLGYRILVWAVPALSSKCKRAPAVAGVSAD
jgi:sulfoxide reductase heme-binding subunit YedZ